MSRARSEGNPTSPSNVLQARSGYGDHALRTYIMTLDYGPVHLKPSRSTRSQVTQRKRCLVKRCACFKRRYEDIAPLICMSSLDSILGSERN